MNPYISTSQKSKVESKKYNVLKIGLTAPREILKKRISDRLLARFNNGLVEEAKDLHKKGVSFKRMKKLGLEYGMLAKLLDSEISENQFLEQLSVKICQYAKRQMTWFKADKNISWFDITQQNWRQEVEKQIQKWYY